MFKYQVIVLCSLLSMMQFALASINPQPRIINGDIAHKIQFPWQVAIILDPKDAYQSYVCSGSLLADRWVVTAAHCADRIKKQNKTSYVLIGSDDLSRKATRQPIKVQYYYIHEQYNSSSFNHDIALIELAQPVDFIQCGESCKTIETITGTLEKKFAKILSAAQVAGWGVLEDCEHSQSELCQKYSRATLRQPELYPTSLRYTTLSLSHCISPRSKYLPEQITENMLCAESPTQENITDTCFGDSGAGLIVQSELNQPYLLGVASWGVGCANQDYPGVYTRVANYTDWIESYTLSDKNNDELKEKHAGSIGFITVFLLMGFGMISSRLRR